jgi:ankyrin repeat protein
MITYIKHNCRRSSSSSSKNNNNMICKRRRKEAPSSIYLTLWEIWATKSDKEDPQVDWNKLVRIVTRKPSVAAYSDEDRRGMLLLHFACALYPPVEVVEALLEANADAVRHTSLNAGITPLMIACGRDASPDVIRLLLRNAKDTMNIHDASGYTAIHWACREDVSKDIVRQLLIINPRAAHHRTSESDGVTPTDILIQSRTNKLFSPNQWGKICYMLWARKYGTIVSRSGQAFSTLHAALALKCPLHIIELAIERHVSDVAGVRDVFGNLPIHYAVQCDYAYFGDTDIIRRLLQYFPQGAACKNASGRFPLLEALKHGYTWSLGIRELYVNHPAAITIMDFESSLYPCALSALFSCDVETTYCLIREHPQLISIIPTATEGNVPTEMALQDNNSDYLLTSSSAKNYATA